MSIHPKRGLLVVISAPSGCGKTTVISKLLSRNLNLKRSISGTTRKPRKEEVDGRDYFFLSEQKFLENKRKKAFLESARLFGHYYGTFKQSVLKKLTEGRDVVLTIDVDGASQVRKKMKGIFIFLMPPSIEDLKKRLQNRQSDSKKQIEQRLERANAEITCAKNYDYVVINRYVNETIDAIESIIEKEKKKRVSSNREKKSYQSVRP